MPCRTYETPEEIARFEQEARERNLAPLREEIHVLKAELAERDAMLCGVMSSICYLDGYNGATINVEGRTAGLYQLVHDNFDETDSGVTWSQLEAWWSDHLIQDEARKRKEAVILAAKRAAALAKLTPAEREILGV